ncbi:MAG TPA: HAMP domain-containing sensor histidine kinase [Mycobacteriales bacterium]
MASATGSTTPPAADRAGRLTPRRKVGLRHRIVLLAVTAATLATTLFGLPLAIAAAHNYRNDERHELERLADRAAITVSADVVRGRNRQALPHGSRTTPVGLYDDAGQRTRGTGPARADAVVRSALRGTVANGQADSELLVAVPISDGGRVVGVIRVGTPTSEVNRRTAITWLLMFGLGCVAIGLTWLLARRQARRLAAPLEDVAAAAQRLGEGDFSARAGATAIPEIDAVAGAVNTTAQRLGELVARERAFSADASHQLRTPLTGLRLGLETALSGPDDELRPAIGSAIDGADRVSRTVDDLLTLARDTTGSRGTVDVAAVVQEVRRTATPLLTAAGRTIETSAEDGVAAAQASPAAIRQVLAVLVDNAVRHGAGTVRITVRDAANAVAVDVGDEGRGITGDTEAIFLRRTRADSGHGIGLALARTLAEAEGGRLELSNATPPRFTLLLRAHDTAGDGPDEG